MSCGQIALGRVGIKVSKYYASEIDKYAIAVTQANYPDTIQLGSVVDVDCSKLDRIDMLIGGSPCQSFSFAGKRKGMSTKCETEILTLEHYLELKADGYEFEGQSYLFWEYMRVLKEVKPKYFLLENVMMGEKWERVLSKAIGVNPIEINSALVSAQSRRRLYWTNIGMEPRGLFGDMECVIPQPKDKGILLRDVLETEVEEKYYLSNKMLNVITQHGAINTIENTKSNCILTSYHKMGGRDQQYVKDFKGLDVNKKGRTLRNGGKQTQSDKHNHDLIIVASRGRNPENPSDITTGASLEQRLEPRTDGKTNTLTSVQKDNMVMQLNPSTESNGQQPYQQNRVYSPDGISPALSAQLSSGSHAILEKYPKLVEDKSNSNLLFHRKGFKDNSQVYGLDGKCGTLDTAQGGGRGKYTLLEHRIRRLTEKECCRLQTVDDNYFIKDGKPIISSTQQYRCLGNGWTVDVIAYIFSFISHPSAQATTPT
jgi:DNA (cytosine-5)-methyltransferase 3A